RFWWRALAWSRCEGNLKEIQQQEDDLFGSKKSQSRVHIRLVPPQPPPRTLNASDAIELNNAVVAHGVQYFGYGLMQGSGKKKTKDPQDPRQCLASPFTFGVELRVRDV